MTTELKSPAAGLFHVTEGKNVTIHTFISTEATFGVTTSIIELKDQLFIVDGQLVIPNAKAVLEYANRLKKPITRVYLSHAHPDHFLGLDVFGVPIYSLAGVKSRMEEIGEWMRGAVAEQWASTPGMIPDTLAVITDIVVPGVEIISGAKFDFIEMKNGETESALVIAFPDENILIAQDLVYNNTHLFVAEKNFDGWRDVINELKSLPYTIIIPGHGVPGGPELYDEVIAYLNFAEKAVEQAKSEAELKSILLGQFPLLDGAVLIEEESLYLFPEKR